MIESLNLYNDMADHFMLYTRDREPSSHVQGLASHRVSRVRQFIPLSVSSFGPTVIILACLSLKSEHEIQCRSFMDWNSLGHNEVPEGWPT